MQLSDEQDLYSSSNVASSGALASLKMDRLWVDLSKAVKLYGPYPDSWTAQTVDSLRQLFSIFFHEYVHFLQLTTTVSGASEILKRGELLRALGLSWPKLVHLDANERKSLEGTGFYEAILDCNKYFEQLYGGERWKSEKFEENNYANVWSLEVDVNAFEIDPCFMVIPEPADPESKMSRLRIPMIGRFFFESVAQAVSDYSQPSKFLLPYKIEGKACGFYYGLRGYVAHKFGLEGVELLKATVTLGWACLLSTFPSRVLRIIDEKCATDYSKILNMIMKGASLDLCLWAYPEVKNEIFEAKACYVERAQIQENEADPKEPMFQVRILYDFLGGNFNTMYDQNIDIPGLFFYDTATDLVDGFRYLISVFGSPMIFDGQTHRTYGEHTKDVSSGMNFYATSATLLQAEGFGNRHECYLNMGDGLACNHPYRPEGCKDGKLLEIPFYENRPCWAGITARFVGLLDYEDSLRIRAYFIWQKRGSPIGDSLTDWVAAIEEQDKKGKEYYPP